MFEVIIIDDDLQVRERLKSIIAWDRLPIHLACEAADSETAMELYLLHRPRIVITDINIPIINGLDLAAKLQKEDPDLQIIVITGYNDFEFVRKSVDVGAVDLLSKPLFPETINKSLEKAVGHFKKLQEEKLSVSFLQNLVKNNLPQMQESFILNLISNASDTPSRLAVQFRQLGLQCDGPYYAVAILAIQTHASASAAGQEELLSLLRDMLNVNLRQAGFQVLIYLDPHSRLNCILGSENPAPDNRIEELLMRMREQMHLISGALLLAGIGPTVDALERLYESRSGALTALNYQCVLGNASVMHFKNMKQMDTVFHTRDNIQNFLLKMFRENNLGAISTAIRNHTTVLCSYGSNRNSAAQQFLFEYVQAITNEALRLGLDLERMESYAATISRLFRPESMEKRVQSVLDLTQSLLDALTTRHTAESHHLVKMAKQYIQENISDDQLCLDTISDHVGLSKIYFCKLFHQVEGISFSAYLKRERVKLAKELLRTTNMKIFEISEAAGFSNAKYFSFAFKQAVGLTPMEYQRQPHKKPS